MTLKRDRIIEIYAEHTNREIAKELDTSTNYIQNIARKYGLKKMPQVQKRANKEHNRRVSKTKKKMFRKHPELIERARQNSRMAWRKAYRLLFEGKVVEGGLKVRTMPRSYNYWSCYVRSKGYIQMPDRLTFIYTKDTKRLFRSGRNYERYGAAVRYGAKFHKGYVLTKGILLKRLRKRGFNV